MPGKIIYKNHIAGWIHINELEMRFYFLQKSWLVGKAKKA